MWGLPKEMEGSAYDLKIKEMSDNGMLLALAAGNDGEDLDARKKSWLTKGRRFYPACFPNHLKTHPYSSFLTASFIKSYALVTFGHSYICLLYTS